MKKAKRHVLQSRRVSARQKSTAIIVKRSTIHGRGVFAGRTIRRGEIIIRWKDCSARLTAGEVKELSASQRKRVSFIDGQYILFKPPACYVNHSCDANSRGAKQVDVARRAIKKGEEITVNYLVERVPNLNLTCKCGAPNCVGWLDDQVREAKRVAGHNEKNFST